MSNMLPNIQRIACFSSCLLAALFALPTLAAESQSVDEMLKAATSGAKDARYTAIDDLGERHANAAQVVPALVKQLGDSDPQVRWRTARTLGEYRGQAKEAVEAVRQLLSDEDVVVQYHAAVALGKLEDKSDATVEALVQAATSKDARVARAAIAAIRSLQPGPKRVAEVLGKALKSNDQAITLHAMETIVEQGDKATPFLKEALKNPDTAYLACTAIESIGPEAAGTVPELTAILGKTKHSKMLIQTLLALAAIGPQASSAAPQITPLLDYSTDATVPVAAAYALGSIGAKDVDAELKRATAKNDPFIQMMAYWAIAKTHPDDEAATKTAVEKLAQALKSDKPHVRTAAAKSIQSLHAPPEVVAPVAITLINDPNPEVRANVIEAVASLGESVVPRVAAALKNPQLRGAALEVVKRLGPKAAGAVKPLVEAAGGADAKARTEIQLALAAIGPAAEPATEMLLKSLASKDAGERESALLALRKIGPGAKAAVKPLLERMKADDSFEADAAAWALARIAPGDGNVSAAVVSKLIKGLASADEQSRVEAVDALAEMGAKNDAVKSALTKAAKEDSSAMVRTAAEAALNPKAGE
ncbi:MAG: HEAT repeat domain-containing protein [Pirellulales bacterium]